ncbi:hypothetical protein LIER_20902 [Lithospermum erythrorhizon]|uniref:Uncharacterized protein n=1 Tax=Lithospermum erythrorhizon TaxID=34254 RepID=A0AAV3QN95_LITER
MVKIHGGTSGTNKRGRGDKGTQPPQLVGVKEKGEHIPLQSTPPQSKQQMETPAQNPDVCAIDEGMGMHVPPTGNNSGKNPIPNSISTTRVASTEILISPIEKNQEGRNLDSQHVVVDNIVEEVDPERVTKNVEGVQPGVKDTSIETRFKFAKTHSSIDPTDRASAATLEKKRAALSAGGDVIDSAELVEAIDLEELETLVEKKATKKCTCKAKNLVMRS